MNTYLKSAIKDSKVTGNAVCYVEEIIDVGIDHIRMSPPEHTYSPDAEHPHTEANPCTPN